MTTDDRTVDRTVDRAVDLAGGAINVRRFGPDEADAPTAVFVHGFLVDGTLWDPVAARLAEYGVRSIVADWPLGSHRIPVPADRQLSPSSVADSVLDLLATLDLRDVVLVGSDTGGAICQLALAGDHARIGGLVLTNCDAFETFPPRWFRPLFFLAKFRPTVWNLTRTVRVRAVRHSAVAYGPLIRRPRSATLTRGWAQSAIGDAAIRRDINRFTRAMSGKELRDAASWLGAFDKPSRVVWGTRDRHFKVALGRRLVEALPQAELIEVDDATTFVSIDRPDAVVDAIQAVIAMRTTSPATS